ncbi:MAG: hypothetical protein HY554_10700, partial [Elusimicrobia bacterium]|nr:hypothetical protein [Elusimicrobiota bacterium]
MTSASRWLLLASVLLIPRPAAAAARWNVNGATVSAASTNQLTAHSRSLSASDGAGGLYTVWVDSVNVGSTGNLNVYAQHLDSSGAPVSGWTAGGVQVSTTPTRSVVYDAAFAGSNVMPAAASDGAGGLIVVWQDWRSGNGDVYAQRLSAAGAKLWAPEGVLVADGPTAAGDQAGAPFLADDGDLFVLFYDSAPLAQGGLNFRVQKLDASNGARLLQAYGNWIASTSAQALTGFSEPVTDAAGGLLFAWGDRHAGTGSDAFAARVDADGNRVWVSTLSAAANDQGNQINSVSDGSGGMYSVWVDSRAGGGENDVYGTRVSVNGTAASGWTIGGSGGSAICAYANAFQVAPIAERYASDLVVTWLDSRSGVVEAYAQRMGGASGAAVWTTSGVPVFQFAGGLSNVAESPFVAVSSGNIFFATGWLNIALGCGSVCYTELAAGQSLDPADGSRLFGSTGTLLGQIAFDPLQTYLPRGFEA